MSLAQPLQCFPSPVEGKPDSLLWSTRSYGTGTIYLSQLTSCHLPSYHSGTYQVHFHFRVLYELFPMHDIPEPWIFPRQLLLILSVTSQVPAAQREVLSTQPSVDPPSQSITLCHITLSYARCDMIYLYVVHPPSPEIWISWQWALCGPHSKLQGHVNTVFSGRICWMTAWVWLKLWGVSSTSGVF